MGDVQLGEDDFFDTREDECQLSGGESRQFFSVEDQEAEPDMINNRISRITEKSGEDKGSSLSVIGRGSPQSVDITVQGRSNMNNELRGRDSKPGRQSLCCCTGKKAV